jgi:LmbE family N-acetylglucosaminyl deacetylase
VCIGFSDGFFPAEGHAIKRYFEELKTQVTPDLVLTHYRDNRHQDHRMISDLTWNTFRNHLVLEYEVPKFDGDLGQPNCFVPVDDEQRSAKEWFTGDIFNALMRLRGVECRSRTGYAEAFHARKIVAVPTASRRSGG